MSVFTLFPALRAGLRLKDAANIYFRIDSFKFLEQNEVLFVLAACQRCVALGVSEIVALCATDLETIPVILHKIYTQPRVFYHENMGLSVNKNNLSFAL